MARPRLDVDIALVLRLRDVEHLGWTRLADKYQKSTGQLISRDTLERRYNEAKVQQTSSVANYVKVSPAITRPTTKTPRKIAVNGKKCVIKKGEPAHITTKIIKPVCSKSQLRLFQ